MTYATIADLNVRFDESSLLRLGDADQQNKALNDASVLIDGYIGGRYSLPLSNPPAVLTGLCCDVARYLLHDKNVPEVVKARYEQAVAMLNKFGSGKLSLLPPSSDDNKSSDLVEFQSSPAMFGRDKSKGFI